MAVEMNIQQQSYKHYCRICKKGFMCGRALGGHMRAHGINDDLNGMQADPDDDPPTSCGGEWNDKLNPSAGSKRMYALRSNYPNRPKTCRVCENCGKEFSSWKSFLEHGKCSSEDDAGGDSVVSSPRSDGGDGGGEGGIGAGWSKGKRSRRYKVVGNSCSTNCPSSEEEDLANCLVMLSSARVEPMVIVETEESCASASKEEDRKAPVNRAAVAAYTAVTDKTSNPPAPPPRGVFECKACKKVFPSHQALGGHRASHKKVKGCFAAKLDHANERPAEEEATTHDGNEEPGAMAIVPFDNGPVAATPLKKKSKVHECTICHRVFTSGQALGGHKRCHWLTGTVPDPASVAKLQQIQEQQHHQYEQQLLQLAPIFEKQEKLDLNLPARADDAAAGALTLEVSAALCLQPWIDQNNNNNINDTNNNNDTNTINNNNNNSTTQDVDDEEVSKTKLSDLKNMNMGGESSSPWLQVGIGSGSVTTNEGAEP